MKPESIAQNRKFHNCYVPEVKTSGDNESEALMCSFNSEANASAKKEILFVVHESRAGVWRHGRLALDDHGHDCCCVNNEQQKYLA